MLQQIAIFLTGTLTVAAAGTVVGGSGMSGVRCVGGHDLHSLRLAGQRRLRDGDRSLGNEMPKSHHLGCTRLDLDQIDAGGAARAYSPLSRPPESGAMERTHIDGDQNTSTDQR